MTDFFELFLPGEHVRYVPSEKHGIILGLDRDGAFYRVRWDDGEEATISGVCLTLDQEYDAERR